MIKFEIIIINTISNSLRANSRKPNNNRLFFEIKPSDKKIYPTSYDWFHSTNKSEKGYRLAGFLKWLDSMLKDFKLSFICAKKYYDHKDLKIIRKRILIDNL